MIALFFTTICLYSLVLCSRFMKLFDYTNFFPIKLHDGPLMLLSCQTFNYKKQFYALYFHYLLKSSNMQFACCVAAVPCDIATLLLHIFCSHLYHIAVHDLRFKNICFCECIGHIF